MPPSTGHRPVSLRAAQARRCHGDTLYLSGPRLDLVCARHSAWPAGWPGGHARCLASAHRMAAFSRGSRPSSGPAAWEWEGARLPPAMSKPPSRGKHRKSCPLLPAHPFSNVLPGDGFLGVNFVKFWDPGHPSRKNY